MHEDGRTLIRVVVMCTCSSRQAEPHRANQGHADALVLRVDDMNCGHCASTISKAIEAAIPGSSVDADPASKIVSVRGADDPARVRAIISGAGYRAA